LTLGYAQPRSEDQPRVDLEKLGVPQPDPLVRRNLGHYKAVVAVTLVPSDEVIHGDSHVGKIELLLRTRKCLRAVTRLGATPNDGTFAWVGRQSVACPLLAQSGHRDGLNQCLLSRVKRTLVQLASMSVIDPKRTLAAL